MRAFDYNSFADLTHVFDLKKGHIVPPQPKARVILYSSTILKPRNVQSRFFDPEMFIPQAKQPFRLVSAPKEKSAQKSRPILRLKKKVEIAPFTPLTRRSSAEDLAAAFKAEMALMRKKTQKAHGAEKLALEEAFMHRRRHPLSHKPWSELLAAAELPVKSKNFDMAAAFKAEMQAFMAGQARIGAGETSAATTPVKFKAASERKNVISQLPQRRVTPTRQRALAA